MKRLKSSHLTASLHTVTSVTNVALFIAKLGPAPGGARALVKKALTILNPDYADAVDVKGDPTIEKIIERVERALAPKDGGK